MDPEDPPGGPAGTPGARDPVHAVGIGPGDPDYVTPLARRVLGRADAVVGFETVVAFVASLTDADLLTCSYDDEAETLDRFGARVAEGAAGAAVLMGDPNVSGYRFLEKVEAVVDRPVRVVPGISSIQVAASRARTPLEDSTFVTLHQRGPLDEDLERLARAVGDRHLLVLPRPGDWMPGDIAAFLVRNGARAALEAFVFERLTLDDEAVHRSTVGALAETGSGAGADDSPFSDLSVVVVRNDA